MADSVERFDFCGRSEATDTESGIRTHALEVNLVLRPYQISALPQMSMEVGQMEEVLIKPCRHEFHRPCPLPHCRHQIAFSAHGGIELNVVPVLILVLKKAGIEKNVRAC